MKKLLPLGLVIIFSFACNNEKKEGPVDKGDKTDSPKTENPAEKEEKKAVPTVVGKWKPVEANIKGMDESEKKDLLENSTIEFTPSGSYLATENNKVETGTYAYDPVSNNLTVTEGRNNDRVRTFKISWENETLVMTSTDDEGAVKLRRL
jgi:hypothetical protein